MAPIPSMRRLGPSMTVVGPGDRPGAAAFGTAQGAGFAPGLGAGRAGTASFLLLGLNANLNAIRPPDLCVNYKLPSVPQCTMARSAGVLRVAASTGSRHIS